MCSKLNVLNQIGVHFTQEYHQEQLGGLKVISSPQMAHSDGSWLCRSNRRFPWPLSEQ